MPNRHETLEQARAALARGHALEAGRQCARLLSIDPDDVDARYLHARCQAALGNWAGAAGDFRRTLRARPDFEPAWIGLGLCLIESGQLEEAAAAFREALARNPRLADAYNNLGVIHDRLGRLAEAAEYFRRAIAVQPVFLMALLNLGDVLLRLGQASNAVAVLQSAVTLFPRDARVYADLGAAQLAAGDFAAAVAVLERAIVLDNDLAAAAVNLGEAWRNLNSLERAEASFHRALAVRPDLAEAHLGLGRIALERGHSAEAQMRLQRAVQLRPSDAEMALTAASALERLGYSQNALAIYDLALRFVPGDVRLHDARGTQLLRAGHDEEALASFDRALAIEPQRPDSLLNRGRALESLGRHPEAVDCIERALALRPAHGPTIAALASCAFRVCDWQRLDSALEQLSALPLGLDFLPAFLLLAVDVPPAQAAESMRRRGTRLADTITAKPAARGIQSGRGQRSALRIAYLSPDYREHAVAHALVGVIERHDRRNVTSVGISLAASDESAIGHRLRGAFDEFIDASSMSDDDIARTIEERDIDIAVDLAGHTAGARTAVFARRPAPVQINYLGFAASTGCTFIDYMVADAVVLPPADEPLYTERVLRLPHCYLPFDSSRSLPATLTRAEAGLPARGFVFCAFNNAYKINRVLFDLWLGLLREVPESVLWLRSLGALAENNLRAAAAAAGVEAHRLIFAPHLANLDEHIARVRLADVFLDTLPYNAHSSAAEALWAGVPLITCQGNTFAARVGASLLSAAGLQELITSDLASYRSLSLTLAQTPPALERLRQRLDETRSSAPLFDTERYTRDLESRFLGVAL
ncbi:MAG TPA: tetratricopeptide repeat protein [Steroidobacteraceae bacterium]|nr:tetratricopeptide repeat protein [Steroidobacteraceae bacterium]